MPGVAACDGFPQPGDRLIDVTAVSRPVEPGPFGDGFGASLQCRYGPALGAATVGLNVETYPTTVAETRARAHTGHGGLIYWGDRFAFSANCCEGPMTDQTPAQPPGDSLTAVFDRMKRVLL